MTITIGKRELIALVCVLLAGGLVGAYLLGRTNPQTKTVVLSIPTETSIEQPAPPSDLAERNVRSAIPAAEVWYQDQKGGKQSYARLDRDALQIEAPGISPNIRARASADGRAYCIDDTESTGQSAYYIGGDANGFKHLSASAAVSTVTAGATCSSVGATTGS